MTTHYLVNTEQALAFVETAMTDSGVKALLGDPATDSDVGPDVVRSHIALKEGVKKVIALAQDPTRTEVDKHFQAQKVVAQLEGTLKKTQSVLEQRSNLLKTTAMSTADEGFGPKANRAALESETRGWVRETLRHKGGEGIGVIREKMKGNRDLASVLHHSPAFLLDLPENIHSELRMEVMQVHAPKAYAQLGTAMALSNMAAKIDNVIRRANTSLYSHAIAQQGAKRVEV